MRSAMPLAQGRRQHSGSSGSFFVWAGLLAATRLCKQLPCWAPPIVAPTSGQRSAGNSAAAVGEEPTVGAWVQSFGRGEKADLEDNVTLLTRTFEAGIAENALEHGRECNAAPFGSFRRVVPHKDRHGNLPKWQQLGSGAARASPFDVESVLVSGGPLLSLDECSAIVEEAEAANTWVKSFPHASKDREATMPDRIRVDALPATLSWLSEAIGRRLYPAIESAFPERQQSCAHNLRLYQASVLRYRADGTVGPISTPVHQDFSFLTLTVPLNSPSEYQHGGTWIEPLGNAVRPERGHGLLHSGRVWHGGHGVSGGTRYALALFFHSSKHVDHGKRFEERASSQIIQGRAQEGADELAFSLRAYAEEEEQRSGELDAGQGEARRRSGVGEGQMLGYRQGQLLWGILAILQNRMGRSDQGVACELRFREALAMMRRLEGESGRAHPAMAGALQNLEVLERGKALHR